MKNSSKNFRKKNNKEYKKNSDFDYYSQNTNRSEKNDRFLNNYAKNNTFSSLKRRNSRYKSNTEFPIKNSDMHQELTNKRNFDDWIWGKHSVYEALSSDRAINRIWTIMFRKID